MTGQTNAIATTITYGSPDNTTPLSTDSAVITLDTATSEEITRKAVVQALAFEAEYADSETEVLGVTYCYKGITYNCEPLFNSIMETYERVYDLQSERFLWLPQIEPMLEDLSVDRLSTEEVLIENYGGTGKSNKELASLMRAHAITVPVADGSLMDLEAYDLEALAYIILHSLD